MPPDDVARYYDSNTRRFLFMGSGHDARSMHRELWGPGVGSAREATDHIDHVIADQITDFALGLAPTIVDFGCGVGGTLLHFAERFPDALLRGVTVSQRQVDLAERLAEESGHADRCSFSLGDFQTVDLKLRADAIVAIESFVHSHSVGAFLANAARHLHPGGHLIIADDFLASEQDALGTRQRIQVERFQSGWRVPAVCTAERLVEGAAEHGLAAEKNVDLTSLTRPGSRVRDRLTAAVSPLLARLSLSRIPLCGNLIGGNALQIGLRDGFLRYRLLVFRKHG